VDQSQCARRGEVTKQLPHDGREFEYRIKSAGDANGLLELIERVRTRVARQLSRPIEIVLRGGV
jgi:hypothetical protein